jgi:hypothetical protein
VEGVKGRIPEAWIDQRVAVVCPQGSGQHNVLSVGSRTGTLVDVNDKGVVLVTRRQGEAQLATRFFPWPSVYQIIREEEQETEAIGL